MNTLPLLSSLSLSKKIFKKKSWHVNEKECNLSTTSFYLHCIPHCQNLVSCILYVNTLHMQTCTTHICGEGGSEFIYKRVDRIKAQMLMVIPPVVKQSSPMRSWYCFWWRKFKSKLELLEDLILWRLSYFNALVLKDLQANRRFWSEGCDSCAGWSFLYLARNSQMTGSNVQLSESIGEDFQKELTSVQCDGKDDSYFGDCDGHVVLRSMENQR